MLVITMAGSAVCAQEWTELFNGRNLKGWKKLDGNAGYRVEDGQIIGTSRAGTPNTFLATKDVFGDFILEYEMEMDRGLNSGVQFRSVALLPDGTERVNGYQVECDDEDGRPWAGGSMRRQAGCGFIPCLITRRLQERTGVGSGTRCGLKRWETRSAPTSTG